MTNNILWLCNEKGKVRTSHNNRNDGRKTQQRETTREDDRWTCQLAGSRQGVEILKATRDRGIWKDMIANAIKHGTG